MSVANPKTETVEQLVFYMAEQRHLDIKTRTGTIKGGVIASVDANMAAVNLVNVNGRRDVPLDSILNIEVLFAKAPLGEPTRHTLQQFAPYLIPETPLRVTGPTDDVDHVVLVQMTQNRVFLRSLIDNGSIILPTNYLYEVSPV